MSAESPRLGAFNLLYEEVCELREERDLLRRRLLLAESAGLSARSVDGELHPERVEVGIDWCVTHKQIPTVIGGAHYCDMFHVDDWVPPCVLVALSYVVPAPVGGKQ